MGYTSFFSFLLEVSYISRSFVTCKTLGQAMQKDLFINWGLQTLSLDRDICSPLFLLGANDILYLS